ncbi:MAG: 23S rRNA (uracil(1939)-C(5))-methyltransferase RlmD [Candidatus Binatia bacterium]|nr:23S rRNA (uracil(1939)-C(5))-methyltransferase RlmD [Candidatus Binatia bacterium]
MVRFVGSEQSEAIGKAHEFPCPHYPQCVGCRLIGQPYGAQLEWKQQKLRALVATQWPNGGPAIGNIVGSPQAFGYRNQAKLVLRRSVRRGLLVGLFRPGTHVVVDIRACPVHHPLITTTLARVPALLEASELPTYDERTHEGSLRYLVLRVSRWTKSVQVILVTATKLDQRLRTLLRAIARLPRVRSVVHNYNPSAGNVIFGELFTPVTREDTLAERIGAFKLKTRAGAFLQANIPVARRIYEYVTQVVQTSAEELVADLYCGAGALTFHLAPTAKLVFGIEESPIASADARSNVRWNGFHNVRILTATANEGARILGERFGRVSVVTLNPPRKGVDEEARLGIIKLAPRRIVYVSCNPESLLRDLAWFERNGYRTTVIQPFDMFPQTDHLECVAALDSVDHSPC